MSVKNNSRVSHILPFNIIRHREYQMDNVAPLISPALWYQLLIPLTFSTMIMLHHGDPQDPVLLLAHYPSLLFIIHLPSCLIKRAWSILTTTEILAEGDVFWALAYPRCRSDHFLCINMFNPCNGHKVKLLLLASSSWGNRGAHMLMSRPSSQI